MHKEILKYMKIINPTSILQFDNVSMDSNTLTKKFSDAMSRIKDSDTPSYQDFTIVANIESMLYLNKELMPRKN